jgi:hypothetical protein
MTDKVLLALACFVVLSCQPARPQSPTPLSIRQSLSCSQQSNFQADNLPISSECHAECPVCVGTQPQSLLQVVAGAVGFFIKTLVD